MNHYNKFKFSKKIIANNKGLVTNLFSLSVLQIFNMFLPLLTFPYLVKVLGLEYFGLISFAQALIAYFIILTDYGFNYSATREISINRADKKKVSLIFNSVMAIKILLLFVSFLILTILVFSFDKFSSNWKIYYLTFGIVIGQVLFPIWFFQGMEKMKYITLINLFSRLLFTISIFLFIKKETDYIYVPMLNASGFMISGLISLALVNKVFKVKFIIPSLKSMRRIFAESTSLFISNLSTTLYTSSNIFILGFFCNNYIVGTYASIEKIIVAIKSLFFPFYQTLFPWLSKKDTQDIDLIVRKMIPYVALIGLTITLGLVGFSERILSLVYSTTEIRSYTLAFEILACIPFLASLNMLFITLYLNAVKSYRERMTILLNCGLFSVFTVFMLTYFFGLYGTAIGVTLTEALLLIFGFFYFKKSLNKSKNLHPKVCNA